VSARERAAWAGWCALTAFTWVLAAIWAMALLASCSTATAEPKPDAYVVITDTPTSTTLADPGYRPVPAGPPAGVER
jgi:hypothetical protein